MQLNRVVALATPLYAVAAGWLAILLADNVPGVSIDDGALEEIFIAGALAALVPAAQWLYGWQKWEGRTAESQQAAEIAAIASTQVAVEDETVYDEAGEFDEIDDMADFDDLDELDEGLPAEDEEPAHTGG
jgi:hypothetical protein